MKVKSNAFQRNKNGFKCKHMSYKEKERDIILVDMAFWFGSDCIGGSGKFIQRARLCFAFLGMWHVLQHCK